MKYRAFFFALIVWNLFGCQSASNNLKDYMQNKWETTFIEIKMPTHNQSDSLFTYKDNFQQENAIKAQSVYHSDNTFEAWYVMPNGTERGRTKGTWAIQNNILSVDYSYGGRQVKADYIIEKTEDGFQAKSIYDWDNDGEKDDTLFMKTKQLKP